MSPPPATGVSVSTIAATAAGSECHMLKVEGYARLKKMRRTGERLESCAFEAAGHTWRVLLYPNGGSEDDEDYISLYLVLDDAAAADVHAEIGFSLVRHRGALAALALPHRRSRTVVFNKWAKAHGFRQFISREHLELFSGYLRDDCFAVRCDVTVIERSATRAETVDADDLERLGEVCRCKDELCKRHHARTEGGGVFWIRDAFVKFFLGCFRV
ncbi:hypothetical protein ACP70R_004362 [Stipagrostis hirtigluma subsp. patula]